MVESCEVYAALYTGGYLVSVVVNSLWVVPLSKHTKHMVLALLLLIQILPTQ